MDKEFFRRQMRSAIQSRDTSHLAPTTTAYRLIYAESDGIPGLIVDRYNDVLVLQSLTAGSEFWKETLADLLLEETGLNVEPGMPNLYADSFERIIRHPKLTLACRRLCGFGNPGFGLRSGICF